MRAGRGTGRGVLLIPPQRPLATRRGYAPTTAGIGPGSEPPGARCVAKVGLNRIVSTSPGSKPATNKMLDRLGGRVGFQPGEVRWNKLRHGYATARLQTLDHGAPVSTFTVARELGHTSVQLVERMYGHLGDVRHRSEVVEFRVEHHPDRLVPLLANWGGLAAPL